MTEMDGMRNGRSAVLVLLALAACHGGDVIEGGAHDPVARIDVVDARNETMEQRHVDSSVIGPMISPQGPGRIIYEEPVSLAEVAAADTLVRPANTGTTAPESRRGAAGQGGAARDTSRAPQPRPERR